MLEAIVTLQDHDINVHILNCLMNALSTTLKSLALLTDIG